jgi:integrase
LFAHQTGRWCKKIKGKLIYFGKVSDGWRAALEKYEAERDYWHTGRTPPTNPDGLTVARLCDHFYRAKQQRHAAGEITARTLAEYDTTCKALTVAFGRNRLVIDLDAKDFAALRTQLAKNNGPVRMVNEITRVRGVFKFAFDNNLIDRPMRYGTEFNRPSARTLRVAKAEKGVKLFSAAEIHRLIDAADVQLKAMILLGVNAALGNSDISGLNKSHIDLDAGILDYPRHKTGVARRCPLWPETVKAIRDALDARPDHADDTDADAVFITKYGNRWVTGKGNAVALQFTKAMDAVGIDREGVGFYTLRHTFRTIADAAGDQRAANRIMGHEPSHISGHYVEMIDDARLARVVDHVHSWLFTKPDATKPAGKGDAKPKAKGQRKPKPAKREGVATAGGTVLRLVG